MLFLDCNDHALSSHKDQIRWENRFRTGRLGNADRSCKVTVDGTDFMINQPTPFSKTWYSHKFNGPGVRYEIAVCIQTGDIVWYNGPKRCGSWPDLLIFTSRLADKLGPHEFVEADATYRHPKCALWCSWNASPLGTKAGLKFTLRKQAISLIFGFFKRRRQLLFVM